MYDAFKTAFLQKQREPARYYPCPRNCGCSHQVLLPKDFEGGIAVCQCDEPACPDISLAAEQIVLLEVSWPKVARAVCAALNLDLKPVDMGLLNTRQIGSWSAEAVPVFLTIQSEASWFHSAILELTARLRSRFILLAPTARHLNAISQEILTSADAAFFSLQTCLQLASEGSLIALKTPGEIFARFSPAPRNEEGHDARRALALIEQLESDGPFHKPPSVLKVFRLFCMEDLSPEEIAQRCGCSRGTVMNRLAAIEKKTGLPAAQLRRMSDHFGKVDDELAAHGARHIHRQNLIHDADKNDD
jgi:sigma-70-like protein